MNTPLPHLGDLNVGCRDDMLPLGDETQKAQEVVKKIVWVKTSMRLASENMYFSHVKTVCKSKYTNKVRNFHVLCCEKKKKHNSLPSTIHGPSNTPLPNRFWRSGTVQGLSWWRWYLILQVIWSNPPNLRGQTPEAGFRGGSGNTKIQRKSGW